RELIRAQLRRTVQGAIPVDCWIAAIGSGKIVQVGLCVRPIPDGGHDIALCSGRPLWSGGWQLTLRDAIRPLREILQSNSSQLAHRWRHHVPAGLGRFDASNPRVMRRVELPETRGQRSRGEIAKLVTADAAHVLYPHEVLVAATVQLRCLRKLR